MSGLPANSCFRCNTPGLVSEDQMGYGVNAKLLAESVTRFYCPRCLHSWLTNTEWAYAHGRFLDRVGLR